MPGSRQNWAWPKPCWSRLWTACVDNSTWQKSPIGSINHRLGRQGQVGVGIHGAHRRTDTGPMRCLLQTSSWGLLPPPSLRRPISPCLAASALPPSSYSLAVCPAVRAGGGSRHPLPCWCGECRGLRPAEIGHMTGLWAVRRVSLVYRWWLVQQSLSWKPPRTAYLLALLG